MSRTLSLATLALTAALIAVPAVAQQPAGKDSTKATTTMGKHHRKHHKKGGEAPAAAAKDSTKK